MSRSAQALQVALGALSNMTDDDKLRLRDVINRQLGETSANTDDLEIVQGALRGQLEGALNVAREQRDRYKAERDGLRYIIRNNLETSQKLANITEQEHMLAGQRLAEMKVDWNGSLPYNVGLLITAYNEVATMIKKASAQLAGSTFSLPGDEGQALIETRYLHFVIGMHRLAERLLDFATQRALDPNQLCLQALLETRKDGEPQIRTLQALEATGWIEANFKRVPRLNILARNLKAAQDRLQSGKGIKEYVGGKKDAEYSLEAFEKEQRRAEADYDVFWNAAYAANPQLAEIVRKLSVTS